MNLINADAVNVSVTLFLKTNCSCFVFCKLFLSAFQLILIYFFCYLKRRLNISHHVLKDLLKRVIGKEQGEKKQP